MKDPCKTLLLQGSGIENLVGPVGIEPTSSVPETDVLSIERRAHVPIGTREIEYKKRTGCKCFYAGDEIGGEGGAEG